MWRSSAAAACLLLASCTQYPSGGNVRLHMDMVDQPSYRPQRDPRMLPEGSVPRPSEPVTSRDIARGQRLFAVYCTPCHGTSGKGSGPVAAKMPKPADLTSAKYLAAADKLIYDAMASGSGLMPPQAENLWPRERWDIVNYVRKLQRP